AHLTRQVLTQRNHEGHQRVFQQQRANRHDRLLTEVAVRPLLWWPDGAGLLDQFRLVVLGILEILFHHHQGTLTLIEACAMSFGLGIGHLVLLRLECRALLVDPLMGRLQRLFELLSLALLMPVGAENRFTAIVGLERAMIVHALEAEFLISLRSRYTRGHSVVSKAS